MRHNIVDQCSMSRQVSGKLTGLSNVLNSQGVEAQRGSNLKKIKSQFFNIYLLIVCTFTKKSLTHNVLGLRHYDVIFT